MSKKASNLKPGKLRKLAVTSEKDKFAGIEMGCTAKDRITGFSGVVTGLCEYISGGHQALLSAKSKNGESPKCNWFDIQRLERSEARVVILDNSGTPGCDQAAPIR